MSLFRQRALDHIASPERLDEALVAAEPRHWIAFLAALAIVVAALAWGLFGSVPTRIAATGILLSHDSEIYSAGAEGNGQITEFLVAVGDTVSRGQHLALLKQDVDRAQLHRAREALLRAQTRLEELTAERSDDIERLTALNARRLAVVEDRIANSVQQAEALDARLADMRDLLEQGYIDRTTVYELESELAAVREETAQLRYAGLEIELETTRARDQWRERLQDQVREVESAQNEIDDLEERLRLHGTVDAPVDGVVTEIAASLGDVVAPGTAVVRIVSFGEDQDALLFVSPRDGKLVVLGDLVNVEPSVVRKEEVGTVLATVDNVSDLPLSPEAIGAILHNDKLVEDFSKDGAPIAVTAHLEKDSATASGLAWTGGGGPDFTIANGTLLNATITIREQAPVTLILPFLRSLLGL